METTPLLPANKASSSVGDHYVVDLRQDVGSFRKDLVSFRKNIVDKQHLAKVHCVFIVAFDVKRGNDVQWRHPPNVDLSLVEFKAMPSGLHTVSSDYVYFVHGELFGLACFNRVFTQNTEERNARMCSVGILMDHYEALIVHMDFLATESRHHTRDDKYDFGRLQQFYNQHCFPHTHHITKPIPAHQTTRPFLTSILEFLEHFGPTVFVLWRAMMLKKRILMYSHVPIGPTTNKVGWCRSLVPDVVWQWMGANVCPAMFFVSLVHISSLSQLQSYIACTSDSVFKEKTGLWDLYVSGCDVRYSPKCDPRPLALHSADRTRFKQLSKRIQNVDPEFREVLAVRYFACLSDEVRVRMARGGVVQRAELKRLGLAPQDMPFLTHFIHTHNLHHTRIQSSCCCSPCACCC